jgi:hypothetical protein
MRERRDPLLACFLIWSTRSDEFERSTGQQILEWLHARRLPRKSSGWAIATYALMNDRAESLFE